MFIDICGLKRLELITFAGVTDYIMPCARPMPFHLLHCCFQVTVGVMSRQLSSSKCVCMPKRSLSCATCGSHGVMMCEGRPLHSAPSPTTLLHDSGNQHGEAMSDNWPKRLRPALSLGLHCRLLRIDVTSPCCATPTPVPPVWQFDGANSHGMNCFSLDHCCFIFANC